MEEPAQIRTGGCPLGCGYSEKQPARTQEQMYQNQTTNMFRYTQKKHAAQSFLDARCPRTDHPTDALYAHLFPEFNEGGWFHAFTDEK